MYSIRGGGCSPPRNGSRFPWWNAQGITDLCRLRFAVWRWACVWPDDVENSWNVGRCCRGAFEQGILTRKKHRPTPWRCDDDGRSIAAQCAQSHSSGRAWALLHCGLSVHGSLHGLGLRRGCLVGRFRCRGSDCSAPRCTSRPGPAARWRSRQRQAARFCRCRTFRCCRARCVANPLPSCGGGRGRRGGRARRG